MITFQKKSLILSILKREYPICERSLDIQGSFQFLIGVLLTANTTDNQVMRIAPTLFERGRGPKEMLQLGREKIQRIIKPCGLWRVKTEYILGISKILLGLGRIPEKREDLEKLPGVGAKVAAVYLSQEKGENLFPVDTHCKRLSLRWGLTKNKNPIKIEKDISSLFKEDLSELHLRMIYFGRNFCKAGKECFCEICNLKDV